MVSVIRSAARPAPREASAANVEPGRSTRISRTRLVVDLKATLSGSATLLASYMEMLHRADLDRRRAGAAAHRRARAHRRPARNVPLARRRGITSGVFRTGVGIVVPDITEEPRS